MKILVTGFEPFGGNGYNPSAALIDRIRTENSIVVSLLPTSYQRAAAALGEALAREKPDAVILTGVAGGRSEICLEFCALNIKDAQIPDNDGEKASGQSVIPGDCCALFTTLDPGGASQFIRGAGIPCRVSYHAGTYVCNSTYFHALRSGVPALFMHIPDDERSRPRENAPFLSLEDDLKALRLLISFILKKTGEEEAKNAKTS